MNYWIIKTWIILYTLLFDWWYRTLGRKLWFLIGLSVLLAFYLNHKF